jgi:hypothetical protein
MDETPIRAVEMVRSIRDQLHEEAKDMTPDEFREFVTREAGKALQSSGGISSQEAPPE